jgi:hypothetical protein
VRRTWYGCETKPAYVLFAEMSCAPLGEALTANNPLRHTAGAILVPRKFKALSAAAAAEL